MVEDGWTKRDGVRVLFGRWQEVVEQLDEYDAIFFDTFGEHYSDLAEFHAILPRILRQDGVYSFFNGLAATNSFFHDVYCRLAQLELESIGFEVSYDAINIDPSQEGAWKNIKRKYWTLTTYNLPLCRFVKRVVR